MSTMEFIDALIPRVERFARFGNRLSGRVHDLNSFEAKRNIDSILSKTWASFLCQQKDPSLKFFREQNAHLFLSIRSYLVVEYSSNEFFCHDISDSIYLRVVPR